MIGLYPQATLLDLGSQIGEGERLDMRFITRVLELAPLLMS
jgi:hypothetical protein